MNILVLDNYDSFTFNLVHYIEEITGNIPDVYKNDEIFIEEIEKYDAIVLSPGPGLPKDAGILKEIIQIYQDRIPMLGVCLGLQAIVEVFGGKLSNLDEVYHGIASEAELTENPSVLFKELPNSFLVGRYHSWVASKEDFPNELKITCVTKDSKEIMALKHVSKKIEAVQFHPESILTPDGKKMIKNFFESYLEI